MAWWQAAAWGLAGGTAAGVASLVAAVISAGFTWPWHGHPEQIGPRLFVFVGSLLLGALVSAATHNSMSGAWPAFVMGVGAPATIKGLLSGIEVTASRSSPPTPSTPPPLPAEAAAIKNEEREQASRGEGVGNGDR